MRSFFRALDRRGAEYLVISGQAAVAYGGQISSQDLDLWVRPTSKSMECAVQALRDEEARVYKLTPPLEPRYWRGGHAFHFVVADAFVDVMPRPPRVGAFVAAARRAVRLQTDWGSLPVVSMEDLVEIKKTRRPRDYEVITKLALIRLRQAETDGEPTRRVLRWVLRNLFGVAELRGVLARSPVAHVLARESPRVCVRLAARGASEAAIQTAIDRELKTLWNADKRYWKPIIHELRLLRRTGALLPDGAPV